MQGSTLESWQPTQQHIAASQLLTLTCLTSSLCQSLVVDGSTYERATMLPPRRLLLLLVRLLLLPPLRRLPSPSKRAAAAADAAHRGRVTASWPAAAAAAAAWHPGRWRPAARMLL
jgi:hypothetical protein